MIGVPLRENPPESGLRDLALMAGGFGLATLIYWLAWLPTVLACRP